MGYRSDVYLKTTKEGFDVLLKMNNEIKDKYSKPLCNAIISKSKSGFYKIIFDSVKWYEEYEQVKNFSEALLQMAEKEIPYSFVRFGEDLDDTEAETYYPNIRRYARWN